MNSYISAGESNTQESSAKNKKEGERQQNERRRSGRTMLVPFWRRKNKAEDKKKSKSEQNHNGISLEKNNCNLEFSQDPPPLSPPPSIRRMSAKGKVLQHQDINRPIKLFFPEKYQHLEETSPRSSITNNHRQRNASSSPPSILPNPKNTRQNRNQKCDEEQDPITPLMKTNKDEDPNLAARGAVYYHASRSAPKNELGKLESKMKLVEIFSSPHGHDQELPEQLGHGTESSPKYLQQQQCRTRRGRPVDTNRVAEQKDKVTAENYCKASFLQRAKESVSHFAEEIKGDIEKDGIFFCVGEGCGDLFNEDDFYDDDDTITFDADDLRMLNETFLTGLTCALDEESDGFSEDSKEIKSPRPW